MTAPPLGVVQSVWLESMIGPDRPWKNGIPNSLMEVVILRHGERLDEAPGNTFYKDQPKRWFDPPLTGVLAVEHRHWHSLFVVSSIFPHITR
jgi:hypothetical protein